MIYYYVEIFENIFVFRFKLMKILMKISDISNECRPVSVSIAWLDCLLNEFFNQVTMFC